MSRSSKAPEYLPAQAREQLRTLGGHLAVARKRRHESRAQWASRIGVSIPTLIRLEAGDPTVSMGAYATALWLIGRSGVLAEAAQPQDDLGALEQELRNLPQRPGRKPSLSAMAERVNASRKRGAA